TSPTPVLSQTPRSTISGTPFGGEGALPRDRGGSDGPTRRWPRLYRGWRGGTKLRERKVMRFISFRRTDSSASYGRLLCAQVFDLAARLAEACAGLLPPASTTPFTMIRCR